MYCKEWTDKLTMIHYTALDEAAKIAGYLKTDCKNMSRSSHSQALDDLKDSMKVVSETYEILVAAESKTETK